MDYTPERALVVIPHPDDAEVWAGGTIARWVRGGSEVHYVLCTDGSRGTDDAEINPAELAAMRGREQLAAADVLGVTNMVMLGRPDGELEDTSDFRRDLVRQIRLVKPDVVLTTEPYRRNMQWHRDHRIAGQVTLDAVFPYARDHLHFGELFADEGIEPHKTAAIMFWGSENPNAFVDIAADFSAKMDAVMAHGTQARQSSREDLEGFVRARAKEAAETGNNYPDEEFSGLTLAEAFRRVTFRT
ncbi:Diacetylchitobiose deacetylase [Geodia barretti]|uniref:N-acetylglucosaminylphosphatidylinositol deacetylase n=1 Tax=Geodia barretti TaxID=519541 RepID=A0AA35RWJ6_GEOBA|nr:Diacetylchitobiose deacetylase [Geodia barretti]